ncbi:MAG TPA: NAD-dependent epimerase/dehydratase family protein [Steroidobacteraceae bacterium]
MTKVVVLGGNGFLGTHVAAAFAQHGYQVDIASRRGGIDARDAEVLTRFLARCRPEIVVNCIHHGGGIAYNARCPIAIFEDNLLTGFNALHAAVQTGAGKFVSIMGNSSYPGTLERHEERRWWNGPLHESVMASSMPRKALWVQAWAYQQECSFRSIHLVLPNMYGPGDHFEPERSHALAALLRKVWEAKQTGASEVPVWGTGKPIREWLYVEDAAEGILRAAERYDEIEILNLGRGEGYSIRELAETIRELLAWPGEFVYDAVRPDGAPAKVFDIAKMTARLTWKPPTSLQEGLRRTIDWFAQNHGSPAAASRSV